MSGTYEKLVVGLPYIVACSLETIPSGEQILAVLRVIHGCPQLVSGTWPE